MYVKLLFCHNHVISDHINPVGTYLYKRIESAGHDSRFDSIRGAPPKFAVAFFAQAVWVSLCALPVWTVNALPAAAFASPATRAILLTDILGATMWITGFGVEVAADRQKDRWVQEKRERKHDEEFLTKGWWSIVRFPNYSGEILSWMGIATLAGGLLWRVAGTPGTGMPGGLVGKAAALAIAGVSPAFVTTLLTKVSSFPSQLSSRPTRSCR
jgi:protein-S-isoprenylcysteine O-methyltransferase Ste14